MVGPSRGGFCLVGSRLVGTARLVSGRVEVQGQETGGGLLVVACPGEFVGGDGVGDGDAPAVVNTVGGAGVLVGGVGVVGGDAVAFDGQGPFGGVDPGLELV